MKKSASEAEKLLKAAARYIEKSGGKALVIGGISIMERGGYRHSLVIDFTGKRPVKPTNDTPDQQPHTQKPPEEV